MCEIRGVGIDLCAIGRMEERVCDQRFLERCFTEGERAYIAQRGAHGAASLAGLWAAKEAVLKALGTGLQIPMKDVEITHTALGQPECILHGKAAERGGYVHVSITHEGDMAAAFCVWSGEEETVC